jgi:hypothetical protein
MFDSRKGYNVHRSKRCYQGTACADIRNGRQLISRGAASGDRPKLFSISIAPQHGMMPRNDIAYEHLRKVTVTQIIYASAY